MTCRIVGCTGTVVVKGERLCRRHYTRLRRYGDPETLARVPRGTCSREGCERPHRSLGLCETHYRKSRRSSIVRSKQPCATCGGTIAEGRSPMTVYCSPSCRAATKNARQHKREVRDRATACAECGGPLTGHRARTICSEACVKNRAQRKLRENWLRRLYGLTVEEYDAILARQGGVCAGCGGAQNLCVDHDKETGAVRGILCRGCNIGIGALQHDPAILDRLIAYLRLD